MPQEHYSFRAISDDRSLTGTGKLMNPPFPASMEQFGQNVAAFRGALLHLFGEPLWASYLDDEAFGYAIQATDTKGNSWILSAYQGPSGPAIGGDTRDDSIYPVAEALLRLIEETQPADFEAVVYSEDEDSTITYGCKEGQCYWHEVPGKHVGG